MNDTITTGLSDLDTLLAGGMRPGQLIVIAGKYGMGADMLATGIARTAAITHSIPTLFTSCRSLETEVMDHILAAQASVDVHHIAMHKLNAEEKQRIAEAADPIKSAPLFMSPGERTVSRIAQHVEKTKARLAVVEGAHLLVDEQSVENAEHRSDIQSHSLKKLARSAEIPVVVSVPLVARDDRPIGVLPSLHDFSDFWPYRTDADVVLLVHRPDQFFDTHRDGEIDITIAKHRMGPTGIVTARIQAEYDRIVDLARGGEQ